MKRHITFVVLMLLCSFCIDISAGRAAIQYQVSAQVSGGNGYLNSATPSPATVNMDSTAMFIFDANTGYHVSSVTDTCGSTPYFNTSNTVYLYPFITAPVTAACTVTATFAINQYSVSASADSGGSLSASTPSPAKVDYNKTTSFTFNADTGHHVAGISGCGAAYSNSSQSVTSHSFTTSAITSDCTVNATFGVNKYTVSASAGSGGSLSSSTPVTVDYGSTVSFTFNAGTGYHIAGISDTCGSTPYTNSSNSVSSYTFTTTGIPGDCSVSATFAINKYSVSTSAGSGGSLSGSTPSPVTLDYGSTTSFTFNADIGYHITAISGCGISYSNSSQSVTTHSVTTGNITGNCTVTADFSENLYLISGNTGMPDVTLTYEDGGTRSVTSDSSGDYSLTVPYDWTGTITPSKSDYTFVPASRSYSALQSDKTGQNFSATTVPVPTLSVWGMLIFVFMAGFAALYIMRRREKKSFR